MGQKIALLIGAGLALLAVIVMLEAYGQSYAPNPTTPFLIGAASIVSAFGYVAGACVRGLFR